MPASPIKAGLLQRCPRCGQGALFEGALSLSVRPVCDSCGLDMKSHEEGDGPAVLVMLLLGAIVVVPALMVEARYQPPFWVHALLWPVPIFGLGIWMLRVMKAILIAMQYRHRHDDFDA